MVLMSAASAQQRDTDPLAPLTKCFDGTWFRVGSTDRLPATTKWRTVEGPDGRAKVSMDDGYRLMLYTDGPKPVVNLKIERAALGRIAEDRAAIVAQMQYLVEHNPVNSTAFSSEELGSLEHLTVRKTSRDGSGIANIETLIQQRTGTVATAYLIDTNSPGFDALRTDFLAMLAACMEKQ
ncbi:hypothetical protein D0T23_23085 [Duganella sp. BJB475]|nr:hypothetical protein D0T23_23085 [Duganella sp. BJB475]RFP27086.1 hypothetical protein D0T21_24155 [Duganella sp. BJB476]